MDTLTLAQRRRRHHPTSVVRDHLTALLNAGLSRHRISAITGIQASTLYEILNLTHPHVKHHTATQILAVHPRPAPGPGYVPAHSTTRRLQALTAYGYPVDHLARHTGLAASGLRTLIRSQQRSVRADTRHRVAAVYERLSITPGPSQAARNVGQANGWAVPAAWDNIDDPTAQPVEGSIPGPARERPPSQQHISRALNGHLPVAALTNTEQALLYRAWCEQQHGRQAGAKPFARAHGITEWQARQIARRADQHETSTHAKTRCVA